MSQTQKKVQSLVTRLSQNRGVQTRKDAIREFTKWFLTEKPEFDSYTIRLLLSGDIDNGYPIGIIQFCGKQKNAETLSSSNGFAGYQYKESVKLALELWVSCIHESFGNHAKSFQNELKSIKLDVYIQAKLYIHVQLEEMKEFAGILIDAIIYSTEYKLNDILPNEPAQKSFKIWIKEKKGIDFNDDDDDDNNNTNDEDRNNVINDYNKNKKKKPTKWEDVKEEDLIIDIDDDGGGGNDEWFDTLDFVGKMNQNKNKKEEEEEEVTVVEDVDVDEDDDDDFNQYYFEDPLGQKKSYHVKECIDKFNKKKRAFFDLQMTNDILADTYYQFSPNIIDEKFNATVFLAEIHKETDFDELQNGLDKIEKFVKDQSHKMKELVREHFDQFVFCKATIDDIHQMLSKNDMLVATYNIGNELYKIEQESLAIYGTILNRTKKAKILYETLQLIKQPSFKFLFTLPQTIKYHIMMRNYDQIIRIYKRVKNIQSQIDKNQLLNKILFELNDTVEKLRESLLKKLKESDIFGDEQERIIFYLIELDCNINPAIYFLKQRYQNILNKLNDIYKLYENHLSLNSINIVNINNDEVVHQQKKFIKKVCQTFNHYIPSFWKLSKSIIDSKFDKQRLQNDENEENPQQKQQKQRKKTLSDYQNEKIVKQLFHEITNKFVNYIEMALNINEKNKKKTHLYYIDGSKDTLRLLLSAYSEIKSIKILPTYLYNIDNLMANIVKSFLNILFEKSLKLILNTLSVEKWKPHRDIPGVTTSPVLFMEEISKNLQIVMDIGIKTLYNADDQYLDYVSKQQQTQQTQFGDHDMSDSNMDSDSDDDDGAIQYIPFQDDISNSPSNVSKLSHQQQDQNEDDQMNMNMNMEYELNASWLVPLIGSYFIESHKIFADCLHDLVYPSSSSSNDDHKQDKMDNNKYNTKINILSNYSDKSSDKKLLYILGNTIYTKETILEKIWTKFIKKSGIIGVEYISILEISKNDLIDLYNSLEQMVFERYIRCKTLLLNRVIDNSLLCDGINWETVSEVKGIRNHCLQLLLHFVFIHNEVYNSSKQELDNVLISLLEKVSDHLLSTIKQIDSFSPSGALQILIEVDFIENTLAKYLQHDGSQIVFKQIKQLLYQWLDQNVNIIQQRKERLTTHTKTSTAIMFSCFSHSNR